MTDDMKAAQERIKELEQVLQETEARRVNAKAEAMHDMMGTYQVMPKSVTIQRSDGFYFTLMPNGRVRAGCHDFSPEEADAYWGNPAHHKHKESMAILVALRSIAAARTYKTECWERASGDGKP